MAAADRFTLYSRPGCHLCEVLLQGLQAMPEAWARGVDVVDVDGDPGTRSRYGHKIPGLLLGRDLVCHGRLDPEEVRKALVALR